MQSKKSYILFILPGFTIYTVFMIIPLFFAVYYSFFSWAGIGPKVFIGLGNFKKIFFDSQIAPVFKNAIKNNFVYMAIALFVFIPVQILLAYLIHKKIRGYSFFKLVIFLPFVISSTIVGFFSLLVFDPNIGFLNTFLESLHLTSLTSSWFGDPKKAFYLLTGVIGWQGIGVGMVIILANMKGIPEEVVEASIIDGANEWVRFWRIILPFLKPALINVIILSSIYALTQFDLPYIIGGPTGGLDGAMDFINLFFYRYTFGDSYYGQTAIGFGASISVVAFSIILFIAILQNTLLKKILHRD